MKQDESRFQRYGLFLLAKPRALPWAGMSDAFGVSDVPAALGIPEPRVRALFLTPDALLLEQSMEQVRDKYNQTRSSGATRQPHDLWGIGLVRDRSTPEFDLGILGGDASKGTGGRLRTFSWVRKEVVIDPRHRLARRHGTCDRPGQFQLLAVKHSREPLGQIAADR